MFKHHSRIVHGVQKRKRDLGAENVGGAEPSTPLPDFINEQMSTTTMPNIIFQYRDFYFSEPIDVLYSIYIQTVRKYISDVIIPNYDIFYNKLGCTIKADLLYEAMSKKMFVATGKWKEIDISFLDASMQKRS